MRENEGREKEREGEEGSANERRMGRICAKEGRQTGGGALGVGGPR